MITRSIIKRILREEIELPLHIRRRVDSEELEDLLKDIKDQIEEGESLDTAIYDTIRQFIASKKSFTDNIIDRGIEQEYWDSYLTYEKPLVKYVKKRLGYD